MRHSCTKSIQTELVNVVTGFFKDETESFFEQTDFERYETIFDTVGFLFEDYRDDFDRLVSENSFAQKREEQLQIDRILFISWVTLHVLSRLKEIDAKYRYQMPLNMGIE